MDLLSLREHHARTLLIHHRWDVEKLFAVMVEKGKPCLFAEAGVPLMEHQIVPLPLSSSTLMCDICMEAVCSKDSTKMDCGHCFCNNCKHSACCFNPLLKLKCMYLHQYAYMHIIGDHGHSY